MFSVIPAASFLLKLVRSPSIMLRSCQPLSITFVMARHKFSNSRITMFSLRKRRTGSLTVITSVGVQFSAQNQVKTKKQGHHVRRCPMSRPKSNEDQKKKVITSAGPSLY